MGIGRHPTSDPSGGAPLDGMAYSPAAGPVGYQPVEYLDLPSMSESIQLVSRQPRESWLPGHAGATIGVPE